MSMIYEKNIKLELILSSNSNEFVYYLNETVRAWLELKLNQVGFKLIQSLKPDLFKFKIDLNFKLKVY